MNIFICPGFHSPQLTQCLLQELEFLLSTNSDLHLSGIRTYIVKNHTPLSALHIVQELMAAYGQPDQAAPVVFISFSAGVVGAIGAAWGWQLLGGIVKAVIAVDGWGVPLVGNFPIHRLSHDYFTHQTSIVLDIQWDSFYADPPVEHLQMWQSPSKVTGWVTSRSYPKARSYLNAAQFILMLLKHYQEIE